MYVNRKHREICTKHASSHILLITTLPWSVYVLNETHYSVGNAMVNVLLAPYVKMTNICLGKRFILNPFKDTKYYTA